MSATDYQCSCPYCGCDTPYRGGQAGQTIRCPSCEQAWLTPILEVAAGKPPAQPASPADTRARFATPLVIVVVATLSGAVGGWWVFGRSPLILLGVLFGFLVGRTIVGLVYPKENDSATSAWVPSAHGSLVLGIGAWAVAIGWGAFAQSAGWLQGEGAGLLFMFFVLPVIAVCGLIGGPTAAAAARHALRQIQAGQRPESDLRLARAGLLLGRLTSLVLLCLLAWLLMLFYS